MSGSASILRRFIDICGVPIMKENKRLPLVMLDGGREALGRAMLRAHLEHRYEDVRALVNRIAHRGSLAPVGPSARSETPDVQGMAANKPPPESSG